MTPEKIIAAARSAQRRMAVYRHKGEVIVVASNSSKDQALSRDKSAALVGVYSMAAKPEWIEEDLRQL